MVVKLHEAKASKSAICIWHYAIDFKKRIGIATLKNFILYPVHRHYLEGHFYQIMSFILPSQNLKVEGSKSEEPNVHQFKVTW